jgi:hypothetical protein
LDLHPTKTKVLSNQVRRRGPNARKQIYVGDTAIEVLPAGGQTDYLGRVLTLSDFHEKELDHRINKAWAKFHLFKAELCCQYYPLKERMRLFNAVITPSILYGSAAWTMTKEREQKLRVAQRRMLRLICRTGRKPDETWVEWVQRATHYAERVAEETNVESWVLAQRRRKWKCAGHVARLTDNRWTSALLMWQPSKGHRNVGRPMRRWSDDLDQFWEDILGKSLGAWIILAQSRDDWRKYRNDFCKAG